MSRADPFLASLGLNVLWQRRQPSDEQIGIASEVESEAKPSRTAGAVSPGASATRAATVPASALAGAPAETPAGAPALSVVPTVSVMPSIVNDEASLAMLDLSALRERVLGCTACRLCESRTQAVFGVGDAQADWMIVGEGPGANEDQQGEPFVGQAGKLLDNMLRALNLSRESGVFIANVIKCRPPGNRDPQPDEVAACKGYLQRQIALVKPRIIVALGRFAAQALLQTDAKIGSLRGTTHTFQGVPVIVTYHPAYLLRSLGDKAKAWEDLCLARATYRKVCDSAAP